MSLRVALFATCIGDTLFAESVADAVRLLRHLEVEVTYPEGQTCCGQPAFNTGHVHEARRAAHHTLRTFDTSDYVVLPSGSCAGMLRHEYGRLLGPLAAPLAERTFELSEFIVRVLGVTYLGSGLAGRRIAYHHGCHALRGLGVEQEPVTLLESAGAEVVAWEAHQECCGFGGLFSVKLSHVSASMADRKLDTLPDVSLITSADGGCLAHLSGRAAARGGGPDFRHLASVLWEAVGTPVGAAS